MTPESTLARLEAVCTAMHCSVAELRELVAVYRRSCHCDREQIGEAFVSCGDCPRDYAKFKPMPEDEAREVDESVRAGITVYSDEPQPAPQGEPVAWRITDGEGGYAHREPPPSAFDVEWAKRYGRNFEPLYAHPDPRVAELSAEVEAKQRVAFQAQEMAREIASKLAAAEKEVERLSAYGDACTQAEREACAKLAEKLGLITDDSGRVRLGDVDCIAATIRAR